MNKPSDPTNAMICISMQIRRKEETAPDPTEPGEEVEKEREREREREGEYTGYENGWGGDLKESVESAAT